MFIETSTPRVTTACLVPQQWGMAKVHETMRRLYTAAEARGLKRPSDIAERLNISHQRLKNWDARGISQQGANMAQARLGISSTWLLTGEGSADAAGESQPLQLDESKLDTATRFFEQLERSHPKVQISDAARIRIITGVYLELLTASQPNWVEMTVRYSRMLEAA